MCSDFSWNKINIQWKYPVACVELCVVILMRWNQYSMKMKKSPCSKCWVLWSVGCSKAMWRSPLERCRLHWRGLWTWSKRKYLKFVEYFKLNILNINCTGEAWEPEIREDISSLPEILNNLAIAKKLLLVGSSSIHLSTWLTSMQSDWLLNIQTGDNWSRLGAEYAWDGNVRKFKGSTSF